jgi:hypothetical protein
MAQPGFDPLAAIAEAKSEGLAPRTGTLPPPVRVPVLVRTPPEGTGPGPVEPAGKTATATVDLTGADPDTADGDHPERPGRQTAPAPTQRARRASHRAPDAAAGDDARAPAGDDDRVGTPKGNRRKFTLNLSASSARLLRDHQEPDESLGAATMRALRLSYDRLVEEYSRPAPEPVGPFPVREPSRRRLRVQDPQELTVLFTPTEAPAVRDVAVQLGLSMSALADAAIELAWGGDHRPSTPT